MHQSMAPAPYSEVALMKRLLFAALCIVLVLAVVVLSRGPARSETKYNVFCAEGKIEIDTRTLDEMKSARGSDTCVKG